MFRVIAFSMAVILSSSVAAMPICGKGPRINCVVDGDTFWMNGVKYRLYRWDAAETNSKRRCERRAAKSATMALQGYLSRTLVHMKPHGMDRYQRILVSVYVGGVDIGAAMHTKGHLRRWPDGERRWCR